MGLLRIVEFRRSFTVKIPKHRESLTRLRISCHNLFIERGRYITPHIPRDQRWCTACYFRHGVKTIENEVHVLLECSLFTSLRFAHNFCPPDIDSLTDVLANQTLDDQQYSQIAKFTHLILSINECYTSYYRSQDFHLQTNNCNIL